MTVSDTPETDAAEKLERERDEARADVAALKSTLRHEETRLDAAHSNVSALRRLLSEVSQERDTMKTELADSREREAKLREAVNGLPDLLRQAAGHLDHAKVLGTTFLLSHALLIEEALQ